MTKCHCKCHQDPDKKMDCGSCGNTGVLREDRFDPNYLKNLKFTKEKPFFKNDGTPIILTEKQKETQFQRS